MGIWELATWGTVDPDQLVDMPFCGSEEMRRDMSTLNWRGHADASGWGSWESEASYWPVTGAIHILLVDAYVSSTIRLHSWSARDKEQDRSISATHICVSAVGNWVGACKVMSSACCGQMCMSTVPMDTSTRNTGSALFLVAPVKTESKQPCIYWAMG